LYNLHYTFLSAGENLAVHFSDPQSVVSAWHASPSHDANIMSKKYASIGIGISRGFYDGAEGYFFVQLFTEPA
jgi:uncharacterized protein YkwD